MAKARVPLELDTALKFGVETKDGVKQEFYEEGTPVENLTAAARKAAKEAGILRVARVGEADVEEAIAALDEEEAEEEAS